MTTPNAQTNQVAAIRISRSGIRLALSQRATGGLGSWVQTQGLDWREFKQIGPIDRIDDFEHLLCTVIRKVDFLDPLYVVGVPGPVSRGEIHFSPQLRYLQGSYLFDLLRERKKVFQVQNNTKLLAYFALRTYFTDVNPPSMIVVSLGSGLGGAIIRNGDVVFGETGCAGEIGHHQHDPYGKRCACGSRGCLEQYLSSESIVAQAHARGIPINRASELVHRSSEKKEERAQLLTGLRYLLAQKLAEMIEYADIRHVILAGELTPLFPEKTMLRLVTAQVPSYQRPITLSHLRTPAWDASLHGAAIYGHEINATLKR